MQLVALGLNHHTAPLAIREQLAFPAEQLADALRDLTDSRAAHEAAILSTCNRTEIYAGAENIDAVLHWLARNRGLDVDTLRPYLYLLDAEAAARHAFRVASGLDSMVLGETQIVGQIKDAVRAAEQCGALGVLLNTLFQKTFSAAKAVRSQTAIGANSVSMAAAGVKLALQIFPSIRELNVLFIGAGEMIELVATHFAAQQPAGITVANRTLERGEKLATRFGGDVMRLADLPERLHEFDAVISCTASSLPIIGLGAVERALKKRRHRPIFMVDLAVPRDIEPEVKDLRDVYHLLSLLESDAAGVVAERATPEQQQTLRDLHAELESAAGNREAFFSVNERFHMALLDMADNRWRSQMVADLRKVMKLNRHNSLFKQGRIEDSLGEHRAILDAMLSRDPEGTRRAMQAHFAQGLQAAT